MATGFNCTGPAAASCSSAVGRGARAMRTPSRSAVSISADSFWPDSSGSVTTSTCGGVPAARSRASTAAASASGPRMAWPWMRRPVCACPVDSRPTTRSEAAWSPASARRNRSAPSPAPTSRAGVPASAGGVPSCISR